MVLQEKYVYLWQGELVTPLLAGISTAPGTAEYAQLRRVDFCSPSKDHCAIGLPLFRPSLPCNTADMRCSCCQFGPFNSRQEQVEHYRLDWHRANLKRAMEDRQPLTEEQFDNNLSDVSSISGSEDEVDSEEDEEEKVLKKQAKVFFLNSDRQVISMFRCLLYSKKMEISSTEDLIQRAKSSPNKLYWVVLMLGGGHFAGAVFKGQEVVVHKTFHSYTVRAKQGGSQSARDNKSATSHPRSAGASLRRYNEKVHLQHIQDIIEIWKPHLDKCDIIFYRAMSQSRSILLGGKTPLIPNDSRLRTVPFPTRRATFGELKRVHNLLSQIEVHGTQEEFRESIKQSQDVQEVIKNVFVKKDKKVVIKEDILDECISKSESDSDSGSIELVMNSLTISTSDMKVYGSSVEEEKAEKRKKNKKNQEANKISKDETTLQKVQNILYTTCKTGNLASLKSILNLAESRDISTVNDTLTQNTIQTVLSLKISSGLISITFGVSGKTMLHIASENSQKDIVWFLLENGCDPSLGDARNQMPYTSGADKGTRNQFRRFMAQNPEKYNYKKASIPSPLTPELESEQAAKQSEKRKLHKKAKQEKEKEKKKIEIEIKKEEDEQKRFLALSDREKRALAAERRLLMLNKRIGAPIPCLLRCFLCAADMTGMVPYECMENKFCSMKCLLEHRNKLKTES